MYKQTTPKLNRLRRIPLGILCILFWIASFPVLFWSYTYLHVVHPVLHFWSHGIPFKIYFTIAWLLLVMILYLSCIYFCSIKKSDSGSEVWKFSDTKSSWLCKFQSMLQLPCICNIFCFRWKIRDVLPILMLLYLTFRHLDLNTPA